MVILRQGKTRKYFLFMFEQPEQAIWNFSLSVQLDISCVSEAND